MGLRVAKDGFNRHYYRCFCFVATVLPAIKMPKKDGKCIVCIYLQLFFATHETILMDPCYVIMLWFAEHVILFEQLFTALCKKGQIKTTNQIRLCVYFGTLPNIEVKLTYNIHSKQASVYLFALSSRGNHNIEKLTKSCQHMHLTTLC